MQGTIQIAGVIDRAEAVMLVEAGVHQIGFPLGLPVHREDIPSDDAANIIRLLRPPVSAVLITYLNRAEEILDLAKKIEIRKVQLHGPISLTEIARLKSLAPGLTIIKSLVVESNNIGELESSIARFSFHCDAFITDTYDPATGACGATGKVHDWDISRRLVDISPKPVMLAGGLNPKNVRKAIEHVRPAGVDAHTGVEKPDGRKDSVAVRAFVREALAAFHNSYL
ncbi:MAG TPA: phosphoribosylanthranilate isomerase [Syntrophales bacterium]|nr:phosphoribosylanthranilate isomerase [Syntrophales bacterium]